MTGKTRYPYIHCAMFSAPALSMLLGGCGTGLTDRSVARTVIDTECAHAALGVNGWPQVVVLDWTGGENAIYPDVILSPLDLAEFPTADGGTLADDAERFREAVRKEITNIYCDNPDFPLVVRNTNDDAFEAVTIVHLAYEVRPDGGTDIGEAEYDPCDEQHDNAAVIFGKRLRQLSGVYTFDEWVAVFANVCAHEIGHTLGNGHVAREDAASAADGGYVELMLDRHTMAEMRRPQRFVEEQSYCPDDFARGRRVTGRIIP